MNARKLLLAVTLAFAVLETVDIVDTGLAAIIFAVLFFACGAWFWRRGSVIAAIILAVQFLFEVTQAHTWKDTSMGIKVFAMVFGTVGLVAVAGVLVDRIRSRRSASRTALEGQNA